MTENVFITPTFFDVIVPGATAPSTSILTCIALPNELVFVDCGCNLKKAREFREDMEKKFDRKTTHLLLTHNHWDHSLVMEIFKDTNVLLAKTGYEELKGLMDLINNNLSLKGQLAESIEIQEIKDTIINSEIFLPKNLITDEIRIGSKEHGIIMKVVGGHSPDSSYVYSSSEKVLCAGDNVIECHAPVVYDTKIIQILRKWEDLEIDYVIPGHGNVVDKNFIINLRKYFENLLSVLENLKKQGVSEEGVKNHPDLPEYFGKNRKNWIEGGETHTQWLENLIKFWFNLI